MNEKIKTVSLKIDSKVTAGSQTEKTSYIYEGRMMVDEENGCVKISYKEESEDGASKNLMTIERTSIRITKVGSMNANLLFTLEEESSFCYNTPYGQMLIPVITNSVNVLKEQGDSDNMVVHLLYSMPDAGTETDMRISIALK